jgi:hypothetical protein
MAAQVMSLLRSVKSVGRKLNSDPQERARVRSRIEALVLTFCKRQIGPFHMEDLTLYVQARMKVAPDSPGRIFRLLQQEGRLGYRVVDRTKSLYEILWVGQRPAEQIQMFQAGAS